MPTAATTAKKHQTSWTRIEITVRGLRLSALERHPDHEPPRSPGVAPILMLHGLVSESTCYKRLLRRLPQDRRVIALDLPGAGYSDCPAAGHEPSCVTFAGMAACVVEASDALGLDRPLLMGHSHGGVVALTVATLYPQTVRGLVLLCPAHPYCGVERKLIRFYLTPVGRAFAHLLPRLPDAIMLFVFRHMPGSRRTLEMTDIAPYLHTLRAPGTVAHILGMVRSWNSDMHQLATRLDADPLALPVLMVWGERDVVVPAWSAQRLAARLTDWHLVTLHGVGHLPNDESPNTAAAAITDWLSHRGL